MKVKKVFAIMLAASMAIGVTACGDSDKAVTKSETKVGQKQRQILIKQRML